MEKSKKAFDCVQTMRDIRDELSRTFAKMTYEEQIRYIRANLRRERE